MNLKKNKTVFYCLSKGSKIYSNNIHAHVFKEEDNHVRNNN